MPNGFTHSIAGGLSGLAVALLDKDVDSNSRHNPLTAMGIGAVAGKLPDILEPSLRNPHHRQFFHSLAIFGLVGYGTKKIYDWEPQNQLGSALRSLAICAGVAFLSHLVLDTMTARSLPLLGKIVN